MCVLFQVIQLKSLVFIKGRRNQNGCDINIGSVTVSKDGLFFNETITYYYFQNDMTVRDYAEANNCDNVISIIDKVQLD